MAVLKKVALSPYGLVVVHEAALFRDDVGRELWSDADWENADEVLRTTRPLKERIEARKALDELQKEAAEKSWNATTDQWLDGLDKFDGGNGAEIKFNPSTLTWVIARVKKMQPHPSFATVRRKLMAALTKAVDVEV